MKKVLVTGATGRTGVLVTQKLAARTSEFIAVAGVRSAQSKQSLLDKVKLPEDQIKVVDISLPKAQATEQLQAALFGCHALVIATSAQPEVIPATPDAPPGPPKFKWKEDQTPEQVDWLGQQMQIDVARAAGVSHVVIVGSMGGTNPDNGLNKIANGNILQWKRKAEKYLIDSGLTYTIVHPGGLQDMPGGERELLVDVDDGLLKAEFRGIPRADVAEVCVQALLNKEYENRAFDVVSKPVGSGTVTTDFKALIESLKGKNCDYSINPV